ncbi:hypothetical protein Golax_014825 [Gossypium laxum]|uniref:ABC transporter domain-containing protein n=1 Tax=Gossypium laxum TaxID=34288 RepID=A0A7J8ZVY9_9ROSI|nr:hypothetical protein [Gossypium laxum]
MLGIEGETTMAELAEGVLRAFKSWVKASIVDIFIHWIFITDSSVIVPRWTPRPRPSISSQVHQPQPANDDLQIQSIVSQQDDSYKLSNSIHELPSFRIEMETAAASDCRPDPTPKADGLFLTWTNLWVTVDGGKKGTKAILQGLNGYAEPGKVLAIMGPSGCGKSTLLDTLAAQLQFPDSMSVSEKKERAEMTIREMGLQDSMDTRIGGWSTKGLSGGQKRRLSICIEIITWPKFLFLDEPTSGLDSAASYHVMNWIVKLAHQHRKTDIDQGVGSNNTEKIIDTLVRSYKSSEICKQDQQNVLKISQQKGGPLDGTRNRYKQIHLMA